MKFRPSMSHSARLLEIVGEGALEECGGKRFINSRSARIFFATVEPWAGVVFMDPRCRAVTV